MKKAMLIVLMGIFTTFVMAQDKKEAKPATKKEPVKTEAAKPAAQPSKSETKPEAKPEKKATPAHEQKTGKKAETPVKK